MNRYIGKVAVLGSGVMGSRIACHLAGTGHEVILLDIPPKELTEKEAKKGSFLTDKKVRNRIVNDSLRSVLKSSPSPVYLQEFASRITTGNLEDDLPLISSADWIIEAVIEKLDVKLSLFEKVDAHRRKGSIVTSNTSGLPLAKMAEGRSDDFRKHFCGTHFFNPPRYLQLLEIIPTSETSSEVVDFLMHYGDLHLGKTTVLCKDTPAFIANRVGIYSIMVIFHLMDEMGLTVEEIDFLSGPISGHPKSATFRTCDVVGIDTLVKVAGDMYKNCPDDEQRGFFKIPSYVNRMVSNGWLGDKSGQGFYRKVKDAGGKSEILALDTQTLEYKPRSRPSFPALETARATEDLRARLSMLPAAKDKGGEFYRKFLYRMFAYASHRIPEIADSLYKIDDAIKAGFGWEVGPFTNWDILGVEKTLASMEAMGIQTAPWVKEMLKNKCTSFYNVTGGKQQYYDIQSGSYREIPGQEGIILLDNLRSKTVWSNSGSTLLDAGEGILILEFHTKVNAIGGEIVEGINKSIEIAEENFRGLVIGNEAPNFSAGANLALMYMLAIDGDYDELNNAVSIFQQTMMRMRYSSIPVIAAVRGLAVGGGCEVCLAVDHIQAAAETYIGLVEVGMGLIPAGGGSTVMTARASDSYYEGDTEIPNLQNYFLTIAQAKVSTSAHDAFKIKFLLPGRDEITINGRRLLADARRKAISIAESGYRKPLPRKIKVLGRQALGVFYTGINAFHKANFISEHDKKISMKLASVMCGGDLSEPAYVDEQYLLDLEREAFVSLLGEKKTLERIQSFLTTGKMLRN